MGEPVGKRVLLVEDEAVLQKLISRYLVAAGAKGERSRKRLESRMREARRDWG